MRTKKALPEGETWLITEVDLPVMGYGAMVFGAWCFNSDEHIRFYAPTSAPLDIDDRFVVFGSKIDTGGWAQTRIVKTTFPLDDLQIEVFSFSEWLRDS